MLQTVALAASSFLIIPNIAPYLQLNLAYPRDRLGLLYLCGGAVSFFPMRLVGRLTDRHGAVVTGTLASVLLVAVIQVFFVAPPSGLGLVTVFALFMVANSGRNVACQTQISQVPRAAERARFMSLQSSAQHLATAAGAIFAARLLTEGARGELVGVETVAALASVLALAVPAILWAVRTRLASKRTIENSSQFDCSPRKTAL